MTFQRFVKMDSAGLARAEGAVHWARSQPYETTDRHFAALVIQAYLTTAPQTVDDSCSAD